MGLDRFETSQDSRGTAACAVAVEAATAVDRQLAVDVLRPARALTPSAGAEPSSTDPSQHTGFDSVKPPPALTVLMAVCNAEQYLHTAVQSILSQTFRDFEFLIIDDGSTDATCGILGEFARVDSRIRLITQANLGLTKSLNKGIRLARGRFLARMDGDDIAMPDRLAKQFDYLVGHPQCVLVGSRVLLVDPEGLPIREICDLQTHQELDNALLNHGWPIVHPAVMMRTDALLAIGGYDEKYRTNQDHDLFLRLAEYGRIANLPELLLHYRQHPKSISSANLKKPHDPLAEILQKAFRRRGLQPPRPAEFNPPLEPADPHRAWAKAALAAGYTTTARKHALASLANSPFSYDSWHMMYSTIRGKRKESQTESSRSNAA